MLYFTRKYGDRYYVYDDVTGQVLRKSASELKGLIRSGYKVLGTNANLTCLMPVKVISPARMCNWADGKNASSWYIDKDYMFKMRACGKKFTGRIMRDTDGMYQMQFSNGVTVKINQSQFNALTCFDSSRAFLCLNTLTWHN